jgi:hypothetical protein
MSCSNKERKLLNMAGRIAIGSGLNNKHGTIISKGGKKIIHGCNQERTYCDGKMCCSLHSEIDAVRKWKSCFLRGEKIRCLL